MEKSAQGNAIMNRKEVISAKNRERQERIRFIRENEEQERERKLAELKVAAEREASRRALNVEQKQKRLEEQKHREQERKKAVEERRKQMEEQERERRESILTKFKDSLENRSPRSRDKPTYAFGSSTPRNLAYLDRLDNSTSKACCGSGGRVRLHPGGGGCGDPDGGGSGDRSASVCNLAHRYVSASPSPDLFSPSHQRTKAGSVPAGGRGTTTRIRQSLMTASVYVKPKKAAGLPADLANASMTASYSAAETGGVRNVRRAVPARPPASRTRGAGSTPAAGVSKKTTGGASSEKSPKDNSSKKPPPAPRPPRPSPRSVSGTRTSKQGSGQITPTHRKASNGSPKPTAPKANLPNSKPKGESKKPSPGSAAKRGVAVTADKKVAQKRRDVSGGSGTGTPAEAAGSAGSVSESVDFGMPITTDTTPDSSLVPSPTPSPTVPSLPTDDEKTITAPLMLGLDEALSLPDTPSPKLPSSVQSGGSPDAETADLGNDGGASQTFPENVEDDAKDSASESVLQPSAIPQSAFSTDEGSVGGSDADAGSAPSQDNEKHMPSTDDTSRIKSPNGTSRANAEYETEDPGNAQSASGYRTHTPTPSGKVGKVMTEEEAKAALAERRREAREKLEREKELERLRLEKEREEEEARIREEQEQFEREEEEARRLAEEVRRAEGERLQSAIEEAEKQRAAEQQRLEDEKLQKEEEERKAAEEAEKFEREKAEREEKLRREEEERLDRKKKLEAIMKRTRKTPGGEADSNGGPAVANLLLSSSVSGDSINSQVGANGVPPASQLEAAAESDAEPHQTLVLAPGDTVSKSFSADASDFAGGSTGLSVSMVSGRHSLDTTSSADARKNVQDILSRFRGTSSGKSAPPASKAIEGTNQADNTGPGYDSGSVPAMDVNGITDEGLVDAELACNVSPQENEGVPESGVNSATSRGIDGCVADQDHREEEVAPAIPEVSSPTEQASPIASPLLPFPKQDPMTTSMYDPSEDVFGGHRGSGVRSPRGTLDVVESSSSSDHVAADHSSEEESLSRSSPEQDAAMITSPTSQGDEGVESLPPNGESVALRSPVDPLIQVRKSDFPVSISHPASIHLNSQDQSSTLLPAPVTSDVVLNGTVEMDSERDDPTSILETVYDIQPCGTQSHSQVAVLNSGSGVGIANLDFIPSEPVPLPSPGSATDKQQQDAEYGPSSTVTNGVDSRGLSSSDDHVTTSHFCNGVPKESIRSDILDFKTGSPEETFAATSALLADANANEILEAARNYCHGRFDNNAKDSANSLPHSDSANQPSAADPMSLPTFSQQQCHSDQQNDLLDFHNMNNGSSHFDRPLLGKAEPSPCSPSSWNREDPTQSSFGDKNVNPTSKTDPMANYSSFTSPKVAGVTEDITAISGAGSGEGVATIAATSPLGDETSY